MPADKAPSQRNLKPARYMAIAFVVLALALLFISAYSFLAARQVQQAYNRMVADSLYKLELISRIHHHEDLIYKNALRHLQSTDAATLAKLEQTISHSNSEVTAKLDTLQGLLIYKRRKTALQNYAQQRQNYTLKLSGLLAKSRQDKQKDSTISEIDALLPSFLEHQLILSNLGDSISMTTRQRGKQALQTIDDTIQKYNLLLLAALLVAGVATFLIRRVIQQLHLHDSLLSSEIEQREKLKVALSESSYIYRSLFRNISIPMWVFDQKTLRILDVNAAAIAEYGYTREEFLAITILELQPENQREELRSLIPKLQETLSFYPNWRHKRKDGSLFYVDIKSHSLPPHNDLLPRIVVAININERIEAIKELERREKQFLEISSSIPGVVYQFQLDDKMNFSFPFISEGSLMLFNVIPEQVLADPNVLLSTVHPDDTQMLWDSILASYQSMEPWELEFRAWQDFNKKYIWLRGHSLPTSKGNGLVTWNGTLIDITTQKEAQEKLMASEANMRHLLDSSPQAIYLLDAELNIITFNAKAAEEVSSLQLRNLGTLNNLIPIIEPSLATSTIISHKKALEGTPTVFETNNAGFWHKVAFRPVFGRDEKVLAVALSIEDITEQKLILENLRHSQQQLTRAQELSHVGSWEYDVIADLVTWSDNLYKIYGLAPESFIPTLRSVYQFLHPDDADMVRETYERSLETGEPVHLEHRLLLQNGDIRQVIQNGEVFFGEKGKAIRMSGTIQDITDRKKVEQEINETKNQLQSILENIPEIIFSTDQHFNVTYISPQSLEILGFADYELTGNADLWTKNMYPDDIPKMEQVIERLNKGEKFQYEIRFVDRTRNVKWLLVRVSPTLTENGELLRLDGSAADITQYKITEAKREELHRQVLNQNRNLQQFAYIVSHNLRAPIANILGLTSIYNKSAPEAPINQRVIDNLYKSAKLLDDTIRDLNEMLTIRSELQGTLKENVEVESVMKHVLLSLADEIEESGAEIETNFGLAPVIVTVKSYLHSILINLVSNALKYRDGSRKLTIKLETFKVDDYICLQVSDNGLGIDLVKNKDKLFGLYRRFHPGVPGKGLGLHLVKTQAELLGGKVEVESSVGVGTVFSVYFLNSSVVNEHIKKSDLN
ncbi:PAS domain S-box protein [Pontibacter sp. H259]|uniref:PAS domain S-box protein n=1 Tax=Pontibacter sp. H259 TaxID=3133421 RepID=UPI0030C15FEC